MLVNKILRMNVEFLIRICLLNNPLRKERKLSIMLLKASKTY